MFIKSEGGITSYADGLEASSWLSSRIISLHLLCFAVCNPVGCMVPQHYVQSKKHIKQIKMLRISLESRVSVFAVFVIEGRVWIYNWTGNALWTSQHATAPLIHWMAWSFSVKCLPGMIITPSLNIWAVNHIHFNFMTSLGTITSPLLKFEIMLICVFFNIPFYVDKWDNIASNSLNTFRLTKLHGFL